MEWRLILDGAGDGAWNMAVDETLAEAVDRGESPPLLRLYRWQPACLSLGFAQPFAVADGDFCRANGVGLVRRPTGGRAVLHHLELTYAVVAPLGRPPFSLDLQEAYRTICRGLVAGLNRLGVPAELAGEPEGGHIQPTSAIPCFVGPAAGEVIAGGRKLVGSAMRRVGRAILQHGSILEGWDARLQAGCLGLADDRDLRAAVATLTDLLGRPPVAAALVEAVAAGMAEVCGARLARAELTAAERARAHELVRDRYAHERWTVRRERETSAAGQ